MRLSGAPDPVPGTLIIAVAVVFAAVVVIAFVFLAALAVVLAAEDIAAGRAEDQETT